MYLHKELEVVKVICFIIKPTQVVKIGYEIQITEGT